MDVKKKRIKILTPGSIPGKGYINGPVLTPYFEDESVIFTMLSHGVKIVEVMDDGSEQVVTASNINNSESHEKVEAPQKKAPKKAPTVTVEKKDPAELVEEAVEEPATVVVEDEEVVEEVVETVEVVEEAKEEEPVIEEVVEDELIVMSSNKETNNKKNNKKNKKH